MNSTLEYLDLALPRVEKKIIKKDQFAHKCYFLETFKHNLYGENMQLNSLVDLIISLVAHLENQETHTSKPGNILKNLDYIRT